MKGVTLSGLPGLQTLAPGQMFGLLSRPMMGKSIAMFRLARSFAIQGLEVLYVDRENGPSLAARVKAFGNQTQDIVSRVHFTFDVLTMHELDEYIEQAKARGRRFDVVIIDGIYLMIVPELGRQPGWEELSRNLELFSAILTKHHLVGGYTCNANRSLDHSLAAVIPSDRLAQLTDFIYRVYRMADMTDPDDNMSVLHYETLLDKSRP
jgi:hypothetical protein